MITTPRVVPAASTVTWASLIPPTVGGLGPGTRTNAAQVTITIRLLSTGANIGAANDCRTLSIAPIVAPRP